MPVTERIGKYKELAGNQLNAAARYKKQLNANSLFRLFVFLTGSALIYLFHQNTALAVFFAAATTICFLALLTRHKYLLYKKTKSEALARIARNELKAFEYDFSPFDGAPEQIDPAHGFSFDLDIFGERSVFQMLNRTCLAMGKETLAGTIGNPLKDGGEIRVKQLAVKELSEKEDFCLDFRTIGILSDDKLFDNRSINQLCKVQEQFRRHSLWKIATYAVPALYVLFIVLVFTGLTTGSGFTLLYFTTLIVSVFPMKKVKHIRQLFDNKAKLLESYADLLKLMETTNFESELLKSLQQSIKNEGQSASSAIKQLAQYSRNLDLAFAVPIFLLLNPLFLWNVVYALKIEKWMQHNAVEIGKWFSTLAQVDALVSLGTFAANNPDYVFPTFEHSIPFRAKKLGHPLISRHKCVRNDINIVQKPFFMIVTGANMAGKSTYLRTVGVNYVLAGIGLPVCAECMSYRPGQLLTNLRTADSLVNNESYFFAELKRLKMIIERLESGEHGLFVILDEILKGTNSQDKQRGSFQLMKRLVKLGGNGIIATHDLALGELEKEFPQEIENFHFDAKIENDLLSFDYKLQHGIAQTMNASYLMKSMGIIG
ncbi:MAG: hypothetical protein VB090_07555 [Petrimonas sp.]|nr:hypothetical protein [Petrimonas sp.]